MFDYDYTEETVAFLESAVGKEKLNKVRDDFLNAYCNDRAIFVEGILYGLGVELQERFDEIVASIKWEDVVASMWDTEIRELAAYALSPELVKYVGELINWIGFSEDRWEDWGLE
ncbi:hypothetical protein [uncultured Actinomyces sp.]|uniref:hypothetical protein n=1 Tax=uncultured Actinomyces sp. TaxID=249061 RepID=UPI00262F990D|nr:hypothetical protein [uncultured Actinomyces sp.]